MPASLLLALLAAAQPPPAEPGQRFEGLFTDWGSASRASVAAERRAAATGLYAPGSPELGRRVGEIVSLGDCSEGERVARAAGDFALVAAVRTYCEDKALPPPR